MRHLEKKWPILKLFKAVKSQGRSIAEEFVLLSTLVQQLQHVAGLIRCVYCFHYCSVKQRTVCIINIWGYTEIMP